MRVINCEDSTGKRACRLTLVWLHLPGAFVLLEIGYQPYCVGAIICNGGVSRQLTTNSVVARGTVVAVTAGRAVDHVGRLQRAKICGAAFVDVGLACSTGEAAANGCACPATAGQKTRNSPHRQ